ncbi:MAG: Nucleotidyltransferase [Candidatus Brocadiaceae bacterium]|nr:Nucleotidyltransferase [Candidatus Brocadiaceae bacterium]
MGRAEQKKENNPLKLSMQIEAKFFSLCEEKIDVVIYTNSSFYKEIIKHAKRFDIARLQQSKEGNSTPNSIG